MIKAKLTTGEIVELVKDCDCLTHDGPHWLHIDAEWKKRNTELLNCGDIQWHIEESIKRLHKLEQSMVSRGIEEIIRT